MIEEQAGEIEKRDIRDQVGRILRNLGHPEPPLKLMDVRGSVVAGSAILQQFGSRRFYRTDSSLQVIGTENNPRPRKSSPGGPFKISALRFLGT